MSDIVIADREEIRSRLGEFKEKTQAFDRGEISVKDYKGFSGKYGSYAQRGKKGKMLRLRMNAGRLTPEKLEFVIDSVKTHNNPLMHFTTCQTVQLHNLDSDSVFDIMDKALDADIVCYGGGGDYPRNVMCSPLSGTEEEYFNVMPYAQAASEFLLGFVDQEKMPRKLKVAFAGNKKNASHVTFRDLGFMAREDGLFDVYAAGGLGSNPRFGVLVEEGVAPEDILYDIEAMIRVFRKHGNYENRAKARTRYMQETLGEEGLKEAFAQELAALKEEKDLKLHVDIPVLTKTGDGSVPAENVLVSEQVQPGLYKVKFHPIGGSPTLEVMENLQKAISGMQDVEIRLAPDETAWIINLTGKEADEIAAIVDAEAAKNEFESSIACIGANICQVGIRDSQAMLKKAVDAVKAAGLSEYLPQMHVSGCPSSCGTHQVGSIGFRGFVKVVDKKPQPAFMFFAGGNDLAGEEKMGEEIGVILEANIPDFLVALANTLKEANEPFEVWYQKNPEALKELFKQYEG